MISASLSDELLADIAQAPRSAHCSGEETLAYYSMLRRKPVGKHHVQICTNMSCMLRGGNQLLEAAKKRLGIGNKEVTARRQCFRWKKSSASALAPALRRCRSITISSRISMPTKLTGFSSNCDAGRKTDAGAGDFRRAARAATSGNPGDQPALRASRIRARSMSSGN